MDDCDEQTLAGHLLDQILAFVNLQSVIQSTQVDRATVASYLAADAASTKLIRHRCVRLEAEFNAATLAATVELPGMISVTILELKCKPYNLHRHN